MNAQQSQGMIVRGASNAWWTAALMLLGLVAAGLSVAAVFNSRYVHGTASPTPHDILGSPTASRPESSSPTPTNTVKASVADPLHVVVIGDTYSLGDDTWIGAAAAKLGWDHVENLSAPGRGYLTRPRVCGGTTPCASFEGSAELIVGQSPDLVVTFGGAADGDSNLRDSSTAYFTKLRAALPKARLVAISPVSTTDPTPQYLARHNRHIKAAVESVGGQFVDVGQPGVGDGRELSNDARAQIAQVIVSALS